MATAATNSVSKLRACKPILYIYNEPPNCHYSWQSLGIRHCSQYMYWIKKILRSTRCLKVSRRKSIVSMLKMQQKSLKSNCVDMSSSQIHLYDTKSLQSVIINLLVIISDTGSFIENQTVMDIISSSYGIYIRNIEQKIEKICNGKPSISTFKLCSLFLCMLI